MSINIVDKNPFAENFQNTDLSKIGINPQNKGVEEKTKKEDPQDAFLTLFMAQLKNQNPMDPKDSADFLSQIAQFNTVSGINKLNSNFDHFAKQISSQKALEATAMVGHMVQVPSSFGVLKNVGMEGQFEKNRDLYFLSQSEISQVQSGERSVGPHATLVSKDTAEVYFVDQGVFSDKTLTQSVSPVQMQKLFSQKLESNGKVNLSQDNKNWVSNIVEGTNQERSMVKQLQGSVVLPVNMPNLKLVIETPEGSVVKQMDLGSCPQGEESFVWDGTDQSGHPVSEGPYVVKALGHVMGKDVQLETRMYFEVESVTLNGMGNEDVWVNLGQYSVWDRDSGGESRGEFSLPLAEVTKVRA